MEWDGSPGVPGVGGAGSPRGTVTWRVWKAPYRETGQVRVLRIIGGSCLTVGEGRYRYETGMARRISAGLDWNRTSWCGVHGFQYWLISSQRCMYVCMHMFSCMSWLCLWKRYRSSKSPVAISQPSAQVLKNIALYWKDPKLLGVMADSRARAGRISKYLKTKQHTSE